MAKSKKRTKDAVLAAEIGAGVLAAAGAAAAGYYYFGAAKASTHRRKTAKWASEMKKRVEKEAKKELGKVKKLDQKAMVAIVDRASKAYHGVRNVRPEDVLQAAQELKQNWKMIEAQVSAGAKKVAKTSAKKSVKVVKKSVKKAKKAAPKKSAKKVVKKKG